MGVLKAVGRHPFDPTTISRHKKARYLLGLSEDDFRDQVVRPLFLRRGFEDGRDLCGPTERGKDALFVTHDPLGHANIYAVQTKKGSVNLSAKASENLLTAVTQLRTALQTSFEDLKTKSKRVPLKVVLCASGTINPAARAHIVDELKDPRIEFLDADELIGDIDKFVPEVWFGVDTAKLPYITALRAFLAREPVRAAAPDVGVGVFDCPATAEGCVSLHVMRISVVKRKIGGTRRPQNHYEELPFEALARRRERLILVLGEAGGGKTTSLRRLAYVLTEREAGDEGKLHIPVLVRAADLAGAERRLTEHLARVTCEVAANQSPCFDMADLREGRVTVLLDGLDEVGDQEGRQRVVDTIEGFHRENPRCQVILTSRQHAWLQALDGIQGCTWFRLLPIGWKEAKQIIGRLQNQQKIAPERVQEVLRRLQDVHGMDLTPLLVTVFVALADYYRSDVPANITELFKKYTEMMLGRWDAGKGFAQQFHAPLKDFLLCDLAAHLHRRRETTILLAELEERLRTRLNERGMQGADCSRLLDELVHRSGLFRVLGADVEFAHFLLQEFFAGRGLKEEEIPTLLGDPWWQRASMFFFGEHPDRKSLLDASCATLAARKGEELAQSSVTLGLSVQACYLLTVDDKADLFMRVLLGLARATSEIFGGELDQPEPALLPFLSSYLWARDGVSCDVVRAAAERIALALRGQDGDRMTEYAEFWQIVALLECGCVDEAYSRARNFKPKDPRLQLALHMGSFLYAHQRVADKAQKDAAERIYKFLDPHTRLFMKQLLKEFDQTVRGLRDPKFDPGSETDPELEAPPTP